MRLRKNKKFLLSVDIGGTKIEICKFNRNYKVISCRKISTSSLSIGKIDFLEDLEKIVLNEITSEVERVGVSFNCCVHNGRILHSSLLGGGVNYDLEKNFSKKLELPVKLENDVNAMALAEKKFGGLGRCNSFVLINLGTGIRLAHFSGGKINAGFSGLGGEISQKLMNFDNEKLRVDDFVSGKGISKIFLRLSGKNLTAEEVFLFCKKDNNAKKAIQIFSKGFSEILQDVSYFYNPEIVVINGSLKKSAHLFLNESIRRYQEKTNPSFYFRKVVISKLDHAACLGSII